MAEYLYTSHPTKRKPNGKPQSCQRHIVTWMEHYGEIPKGMIIHHKNGDKWDNRIENLQMISRSCHTKIHLNKGQVSARV